MLPRVYELLRASAAVVAIVDDRIGAAGDIEQTAGRPYITWQVVTGVPENSLDCAPDIDQITVQINCFHATEAGINALVIAARDAIEAGGHVTGMPVDQRDTATRLYWKALQADLWTDRNT